jgi:hypothetical protein
LQQINFHFKSLPLHHKHINKLYLLSVGIKLALAIISVLMVNAGLFNRSNTHLLWAELNWQHVGEIYFNSDSGWYRAIAAHGYAQIPLTESQNWSQATLHFAFFPLFPMLIRLLMLVTGMGFIAAAFVINLIILYFLVRCFYLFLIHCALDAESAYRTVVLFLLFPISMHIYFIYTEALFITLLLACFLMIKQKQWLSLVFCSFLLALTRPNGLMMLLPLGFYLLETQGGLHISNIKKQVQKPAIYSLLAMPLAFALWMFYQHSVTGHWMAAAEAQSGWNKHWMFPLMALFRNGFWQEQFTSIYILLLILIGLYYIKKWRISWQAYNWTVILLPLAAGSVISMCRYTSVLFPYYIQAIQSPWTQKNYKLLLVIMTLLQVFALKMWIEDNSLMY